MLSLSLLNYHWIDIPGVTSKISLYSLPPLFACVPACVFALFAILFTFSVLCMHVTMNITIGQFRWGWGFQARSKDQEILE